MSLISRFEAFLFPIVKELYSSVDASLMQVQKTRREFDGDITLVVFPLLKHSGKSPEQTAREIADAILQKMPAVTAFQIVKGFLNLTLTDDFLLSSFAPSDVNNSDEASVDSAPVMIEFSSPNTNKPLHLGHIRNNLLGESVSRIMAAAGRKVVKVNLVNDRGIHICKSMLAWKLFSEGETPESSGIKGDHLVGKYYVIFDQKNQEQAKGLIEQGMEKDAALQETPLMQQARKMLRDWEAGEAEVVEMWKMMNTWVYQGFDETYKRLGITFDKTWHESETYLGGRKMVFDALEKSLVNQRPDGSVWADLTEDGLDEKLLLRADGTSVYITQDLATARLRFEEFQPDSMIYVVGNEQNYHFEVLKILLAKMGYPWASRIHHLSYGMVELPQGRMKSREGTVVDADDLMDEMFQAARKTTLELGKQAEGDENEALYEMIGQGALKYFILKVDPKKNMLFNPEESIDFNGNTGPFIQYTHARICSLLAKAADIGEVGMLPAQACSLQLKERQLILLLLEYEQIVKDAAAELNPGSIANYVFELAKLYNRFYQEIPVLKEEDANLRLLRLELSSRCARIICHAMKLLGIEVPERM